MRIAAEPPRGGDPEIARGVLFDTGDDIVRQAVGSRKGLEAAVFESGEATSIGTDPERFLIIFPQGPYFVVFQTSGFDSERPEAGTIEADGSAIGAQPDVAVVSLYDGPDPGLRQALGLAPQVDTIAGDSRWESESRRAHQRPPEGEQNGRRQASRCN
jgi:hypothetical protein